MRALVPADARLTVGIATRNRPAALRRCASSLSLIAELVSEVIVVDDSGESPAKHAVAALPHAIATNLRVLEQPGNQGPIVGRNTILRLASTEYVLLMDDDAYLIDRGAIVKALDTLERDPRVGAVACAQAEADGSPWPSHMQPCMSSSPCVVTAYIGFAHVVRRSVFQRLGGYRESFHFYGEEKDYCLRLLDSGYDVVYLPDALVAHVPDQAGRSSDRYLRYVIRNDCLSALYNEPWPLALMTVPLRLRRYEVMRRNGGISDPGGLKWIVSELLRTLPDVCRNRTPVRWSSLRRWHRLKRHPRPLECLTA